MAGELLAQNRRRLRPSCRWPAQQSQGRRRRRGPEKAGQAAPRTGWPSPPPGQKCRGASARKRRRLRPSCHRESPLVPHRRLLAGSPNMRQCGANRGRSCLRCGCEAWHYPYPASRVAPLVSPAAPWRSPAVFGCRFVAPIRGRCLCPYWRRKPREGGEGPWRGCPCVLLLTSRVPVLIKDKLVAPDKPPLPTGTNRPRGPA